MNTLGHHIRKVKMEDREAVLSVVAAAFERPDEANLVKKLWAEDAIKVERLAEIGGVVVGYCAFTQITCKPSLDGLLLGLGPLAVAPTHHCQGIGAELVETCLNICREHKARLIAVLGDPKYYARFGFEPAAQRKMSWAGFDAGDTFRILTHEDVETEELRTIYYHPAFDDLS